MPPRARTCEVCEVTYQPTYNKQRTCGRACGVELKFRTGTVRRALTPPRTRRVVPPRAMECMRCGSALPDEGAAFCSQDCADAHLATVLASLRLDRPRSRARDCTFCGGTFTPQHGACIYCSKTCARRAQGRNHRQRARRYGVRYERVHSTYIYERDRWRCGICGKAINKVHVYPHLMSPSLDHLVPLSQGGDHVASNLQAAHWICNALKSDGMTARGEQLLLFG